MSSTCQRAAHSQFAECVDACTDMCGFIPQCWVNCSNDIGSGATLSVEDRGCSAKRLHGRLVKPPREQHGNTPRVQCLGHGAYHLFKPPRERYDTATLPMAALLRMLIVFNVLESTRPPEPRLLENSPGGRLW